MKNIFKEFIGKQIISRDEAIDIIIDELDSLDNDELLSILDGHVPGDYEIRDND